MKKQNRSSKFPSLLWWVSCWFCMENKSKEHGGVHPWDMIGWNTRVDIFCLPLDQLRFLNSRLGNDGWIFFANFSGSFFFFGGGWKWLDTLPKKQKRPGTPNHQFFFKVMFDETTIFHVIIWNRPIETTIWKWMFPVAGSSESFLCGGFNPFEKNMLVKLDSFPPQSLEWKFQTNHWNHFLRSLIKTQFWDPMSWDLNPNLSYHSLPKTNCLPLKMGRNPKGKSSSNHPFSWAMLVSGSAIQFSKKTTSPKNSAMFRLARLWISNQASWNRSIKVALVFGTVLRGAEIWS